MKALVSNQLNFKFTYDNIDKDFDFFIITTKDNYISTGANALDIPKSYLKAKSIVFDKGRSFYVMFVKNDIDSNSFRRSMKEVGEIGLTYEKIQSSHIPQHYLAQLLINSLNNPSRSNLSFNNLTGKFLCYRNSWISYGKDDEIWAFKCLEVKISRSNSLDLLAHTFSSIKLRRKMKFTKRKFHEYPQYTFSNSNMSLRRVLDSDHGVDDKFIMKPATVTKSNITYFDFSDYDKFESSKLGVVSDLLELIAGRLSRYMSIDFVEYPITKTLSYSKRDLKKYWTTIEKLLDEKGICLVDGIGDETSLLVIDDLADKLKNMYPNLHISRRKRFSSNQPNIKLIHNKEYYLDKGIDPHDNVINNVQHITLEDFDYNSTIALENVLKELAIKNDISQGQITLKDWSSYGFTGSWKFVQKCGTDKIIIMTVDPFGKCVFKNIELSLLNLVEYEDYYKALNIYEKSENEEVIGLIHDPQNNINIVSDSGLYSIPKLIEISKIIKKTKNELQLEGKYIREILEKIYVSKRIESCLAISKRIDLEKSYSKKELSTIIDNRHILKEVSSLVFEDTDEVIGLYLRDRQSRESFFSGTIDINISKISEKLAYYTVGVIGSGMRSSIENSCRIKCISVIMGSRLLVDEISPLMGVEIVQYGKLSVFPFPFKYLNEYVKLTNIKAKNERRIVYYDME